MINLIGILMSIAILFITYVDVKQTLKIKSGARFKVGDAVYSCKKEQELEYNK
jgi:hypothetical protein